MLTFTLTRLLTILLQVEEYHELNSQIQFEPTVADYHKPESQSQPTFAEYHQPESQYEPTVAEYHQPQSQFEATAAEEEFLEEGVAGKEYLDGENGEQYEEGWEGGAEGEYYEEEY